MTLVVPSELWQCCLAASIRPVDFCTSMWSEAYGRNNVYKVVNVYKARCHRHADSFKPCIYTYMYIHSVVKLLRQRCRIPKLNLKKKKLESKNEITIVGEYKYER